MSKVYLKGSAQKKEFENGGEVINITVAEEDFQKIPTRTSKSGVAYRKFYVSSRKNGADDYGNTHSVYTREDEGDGNSGNFTESKGDAKSDDLPF